MTNITSGGQSGTLCDVGNYGDDDDAAVREAMTSLEHSVERYRKLLNRLMRMSDDAVDTPFGVAATSRTGNGKSAKVVGRMQSTVGNTAQRSDKVRLQ